MISEKLISVTGRRVYLVAANRRPAPTGGIGVFDITDPSNIVHKGDFTSATLENPEKVAYAAGSDFLVVGGTFGSYFSTFDMRDPPNSAEADAYGAANRNSFIMTPGGGYVFSSETTGNSVYTSAISSSGAISSVGGYSGAPPTENLIMAYDAVRDFIFAATGSTYGVGAALDATSPASLILTDTISTLPTGFGVLKTRHDDAAQILLIQSAGSPYKLIAMDTSNTSDLSVLGSIDGQVSERDFDIDADNKVAYVLRGSTVRSIDYTNPASMSILQTLSVGSSNFGISYYDNHVYITEFGGTVHAVDVSNPSAMSVVDTLTGLPGNYFQSAVVQT